MNNIKVSIITVCYNSVRTIRSTILSVINQNYNNIEYIIIDGNSHDGTQEILQEYKDNISIIKSEPDYGIYDAMNKGLKLCSGEVIGFLNSDDLYFDNYIIDQVVHTMINKKLDYLYGNMFYFKDDLTNKCVRSYTAKHFSYRMLMFGFMPPHPTLFISSFTLKKVGYYNTIYKTAADFEYFIRLFLSKELKYSHFDKYLVRFRVGGISTKNILSNISTTFQIYYALKNNKMYFSLPLLILRFPFKYFEKILCLKL